ncbi:MAG: ABC transporter substrate-binding protein [Steroidobacteraceae bacterium]
MAPSSALRRLDAGCVLVVALLVAACSRTPAPAADAQGPDAASALARQPVNANPERLEGQLRVVARPGYFERGATDPAYDWLTWFEADTGCKITVKTAATAEDMVALIGQGSYDLVTASGDAAMLMIRGGLVQPLDMDRVPSFENVDTRLQRAPWHYVDGRHFGVPWQWGPNVLLYSRKAFAAPPRSWAFVFEQKPLADGRSNRGRVQAYAAPMYIADAALFLMATRPELGITDPYELDEEQYAAVLALLRSQRELLQGYWRDPNVAVQDFASGAVVASMSWPFQANTLAANGQPVDSVIPAEGATGWADSTLLAARAKHPNCAYKWLEWSLNARVQGDVAAWVGGVPAVPAACSDNPLLGEAGCDRNGAGRFAELRFWRLPEAQCSRGSCVPYERWAADYREIVAGR